MFLAISLAPKGGLILAAPTSRRFACPIRVAPGFVIPADALRGRREEIWAERDPKIEAVREALLRRVYPGGLLGTGVGRFPANRG